MTQFEKWFKKQFGGKQMSTQKRQKILNEIMYLEGKLDFLKEQIRVDDYFRASLTAALYTKQAVGKNFDF